MNINDIISQGLYELDSKKPLLEYLKRNSNIYVITKTEPNRPSIEFIDMKTGEIIVSTEFERLSAYHNKYNIWVWAWSLPLLHSENSLSIEILKHILQLDEEYTYIKTLFTTSRGIIDDPVQIDINLALSGLILKQPYVLKYTENMVDWYIVLLNKEGLDKLENKLDLKEYEKED